MQSQEQVGLVTALPTPGFSSRPPAGCEPAAWHHPADCSNPSMHAQAKPGLKRLISYLDPMLPCVARVQCGEGFSSVCLYSSLHRGDLIPSACELKADLTLIPYGLSVPLGPFIQGPWGASQTS